MDARPLHQAEIGGVLTAQETEEPHIQFSGRETQLTTHRLNADGGSKQEGGHRSPLVWRGCS